MEGDIAFLRAFKFNMEKYIKKLVFM